MIKWWVNLAAHLTRNYMPGTVAVALGLPVLVIVGGCFGYYEYQGHRLGKQCAAQGWTAVRGTAGYGSIDFCIDEHRAMYWPK